MLVDMDFARDALRGMLREDTDSSGAVMSSRYEYDNVKAPL
jgi:hypothetical protein